MLRRARTLYFRIYYRDLVKFVGKGKNMEERMVEVGIRMAKRGLYAENTSRLALGKSVTVNLARERERRYGDQSKWRINRDVAMPVAVSRMRFREQMEKVKKGIPTRRSS